MSTTTHLQEARDEDAQCTPEAGAPEGGAVAMGKELVSEISDDDVPGLAAEVAYHAIFAIPALIVVLVTLSAVINNVFRYNLAQRLTTLINDNAPESTQELLQELVDNAVEQVGGDLASLGLASAVILAIWAGSNGVGALIKSFNRAYDAVETRPYHKKKGMAVILTIVLGLVINLAFALWVFGGEIGSLIASEFEMGATFDWVWDLSRIPVGIIVIVLMLGLLYYYGPTMNQEFRWVLPGAIFSTLIWGALVYGFSIYLRFASPGSAYGALSGVIVFLFFLYVTSLIFIVGAELNAVLARRYDERYQRAISRNRMETQETVPLATQAPEQTPAATPVPQRVPQPASIGSMLVGVVTVVGVVLAAGIRSRG